MMLFPEFDNVQTLYVIGNGFDLHHGMRTSYSDFRQYLENNDKYYFINQMERFFPLLDGEEDNFLWNDLENALGEPDILGIYDVSNEDVEMDDNHMGRYPIALEDTPPMTLGNLLVDLHNYFEEWVNSIEIADERRGDLNNLEANGIFLNFNYTETLEKLYGIPRKAITYIHGRRRSDDTLILGHCNEVSADNEMEDGYIRPFYERNSHERLSELANEERKDTLKIIASIVKFWSSITDVDKVIVYGHSLNEIDRPYFEKIKQCIKPKAEWFYSCHNEKDKKNAHALSKMLNIPFSSVNCFNF